MFCFLAIVEYFAVRCRLVNYFTLAVLASLVGCMKAGPDFTIPQLDVQVPDSFVQAQKIQVSPKIKTLSVNLETASFYQERWWEVFGDENLNCMVEEALANNLDIQKAAARVLELQSMLLRARAGRFPYLNLKGDAGRQQQTMDVSVPVLKGSTLLFESQEETRQVDSFSLSAAAGFELDFWGRLARIHEAARADLLAIEKNACTVTQTVVAETVSRYLEMKSLQQRIQITEKSIEGYRRQLKLVQMRYEGGIASIMDLQRARRALIRAESLLPPLRQDLGITVNALAVLLGRYPNMQPPGEISMDYFRDLPPVPPGLPSDLLQRRPDVQEACARLKAANARVGAARAARFPNISLTGSYGYASDELRRLFTPESELWSIGAGLLVPVFDAVKLKAGEDAARARYQQQVADYAKTVLSAFAEVESALLTRQEQIKHLDRALELVKEAKATQQVIQSRYERGLADYLTVLDAEQASLSAEQNLVLARLAILQNRVSLHRALGGGWGWPVRAKTTENFSGKSDLK